MTWNFILVLLLALLLAIPARAARDFDNVDDLLDCGSAASLDNLKAGGAVTISAWIRPDSAGEDALGGYIVSKEDGVDGWAFRTLLVTSTIRLSFFHRGATVLLRSSTNTLTAGTWYHVLLIWDGSATAANADLYINGTEVTYATTQNGGTLDSDAGLNLILGNRAAADRTFDDDVAEVGIWAAILSANEITSLANGASVATIRPSTLRLYAPLWGVASPEPDLSGNANHCTVTGAVLANHSPTGPYAGQSE